MSGKKTVLLVDDDADFVEQNRLLLEDSGYRVRIAHSGRQCLEEVAAAQAGPDHPGHDDGIGERRASTFPASCATPSTPRASPW